MVLILTVMALGVILSLAQGFLSPVLFALVVGVVISPLAERLNDLGIPRVVSALALVVISTGLLVLAFVAFEPLLRDLTRQIPRFRFEIQKWIDNFSGIMRGIENLSDEIERTIGSQAATAADAPDIPSVMDAIWLAPNLGGVFFIFVGTLFFFVLSRTELYLAAGKMSPALFRADRAVARYFLAVTSVNAFLGLATGFGLAVIGVEYAVLWGLAAGLLNFILYLGPIMVLSGLLIAGVVQFDGAMSVAPALIFFAMNLTEAQFVTPSVVGQRLHMSPLAVFLAIVFGLWLWGAVGAIIALPVVLWIGVVLRHLSALRVEPGDAPETR